MTLVHPLRKAVVGLILVVGHLQLGVRGIETLLDLGPIGNQQDEVFGFRILITRGVELEVLLHLLGGGLGFLLILVLGQLDVLELDLFVLLAVLLFDLGGRHNGALECHLAQFRDEHLPLEVGFELVDRQTLLRQHGRIDILADEFAVLEEAGVIRAKGVGHVLVGNLDAELAGLVLHGALGDHLVDELGHVIGDDLGGDLAALGLVLDQAASFRLGDLVVADLGHNHIARARAGVIVRNQVQQHGSRNHEQDAAHEVFLGFLSITKQIKHLRANSCRQNGENTSIGHVGAVAWGAAKRGAVSEVPQSRRRRCGADVNRERGNVPAGRGATAGLWDIWDITPWCAETAG